MEITSDKPKILIVDDEQSICDVLSISLKKEGCQVATTCNSLEAISIFKKDQPDVVIQDIKMPDMDGIELLKRIKKIKENATVIIITAYSTWENTIEAMRLGAFDYIKKPFDVDIDIKTIIKRALSLKNFLPQTDSKNLIIGHSNCIMHLHELIRKAALTNSTILIQGESGVGKELVARALHYSSPRANNPFIALNCAAITETLLESELFGHTKGAFTGASSDKIGIIEVANSGTLFLDEVSEMSQGLQVKLLRVIEERKFKPVGTSQEKKVDVGFIAATNKNIQEEVKAGRFRNDLFYRLNVISIYIPPLRERKEDIPLLAGYFLAKFNKQMNKNITGFSDKVRDALINYDWPGNVRELENVIERTVALSNGEKITEINLFRTPEIDMSNKIIIKEKQITLDKGIDIEKELADIEQSYLKKALALTNGNYTQAAKLLNLSLRSFRYKLLKYQLDKNNVGNL